MIENRLTENRNLKSVRRSFDLDLEVILKLMICDLILYRLMIDFLLNWFTKKHFTSSCHEI